MKKLFKLTKSNLKTSRGTSICVFVLLLCAALLFNMALILNTDYKDNFERLHKSLNSEHVTVAVNTIDENYLDYTKKILGDDSKVKEYENNPAIISNISLPFNGSDFLTTSVLLSYDTAKNKTIGKIDFLENENKSGIYLPYLFFTNGYELNDKVNVTFGEYELKDITVVGFINSMMLGSNNCSMTEFVLSNDLYKRVDDNIATYNHGYLTSIRLVDDLKTDEFEAYVTDKIKGNISLFNITSNNVSLIRQSRYITQMISTVIILVIAVLIVVIAVIISAANLSEYIKENLKKIGALKAIGYVTSDIILSFIVQFVFIAFAGSVIGVGLSYALLPAFNQMLIAQTGIPYTVNFIFLPAFISVLVLVLSITITILLTGLRIRKIEAIDALREGITTHSFKKNVLPLNKKNIGLNLKLGLKSAYRNTRMNITTLITTFLLTFVVAFDVFLLCNCVISMQPMVKMICAITPDGLVTVDKNREEEFLTELNSDSRITNNYLLTNSDVKIGSSPIWIQIVKDGIDVEEDLIGKGKAPRLNNEIAIGWKYAKDNNILIGDYVTVALNNKEIDYLVTGYTQNSNYLGKDALITREGFEKFDFDFSVTYAIYLSNVDKTKEVLDYYEAKYNASVVDYGMETSAFIKVYKNLLTIIFIAVIILTSLVLFFVEFLTVRSLLDKKKKEFGILKSLGYSTNDLIKQTILAFIPSLIIGMLLGVIAGYFLMSPLFSFCMNGIGIFDSKLSMPFYGVLIGGVLLALLSVLIVYILAQKIKKINPYELLIKE